MWVIDARAILVTTTWRADPSWAAGAEFRRTAALVEVTTDEGVSGLGETVMGYFCPEVVPPLVGWARELLVDRTLGLDPTQPERVFDELAQRCRWWGHSGLALSVLSGVEMALWDIAGKAAGKPVHALLGGAAHARLPAYASGGTGAWPLERTVEQARHYVDAGFRALKLGTGYEGRPGSRSTGVAPAPYGTWYAPTTPGRVADEVAKLSALREALGADLELALDTHAVQVRDPWDRAAALALARAIEPFELLFWEEPLRYEDPEGYAELRRRAGVPIAGGECLAGVDEFRRFLDLEALDFVQPDASHAGGITVTRRVADLAGARGVGLIVHTGASIGPGLMANLHAAFASPSARAVEVALAPDNVRRELLVEPLNYEDGDLLAPAAPGLGVRLPPGFREANPFVGGAVEYA
ncbi:mandelate racemase/muconate lactonizing enzyme family protein [soil metagenome]